MDAKENSGQQLRCFRINMAAGPISQILSAASLAPTVTQNYEETPEASGTLVAHSSRDYNHLTVCTADGPLSGLDAF